MAIIHKTTLTPGKLELLAAWLPAQPWYADRGRAPELTKAGGFRLDDPDDKVGIEFMVVTDGSGDSAVSYLTPMTYRASALPDADGALVGTTEHGVLGRRWVYDGIADPVLVGQLAALVQGRAVPQMQSASNAADLSVTCVPVGIEAPVAVETAVAADGPLGTELRLDAAGRNGTRGGQLVITVNRVLSAEAVGGEPGFDAGADPGALYCDWRRPDGTIARGRLAAARYIERTVLPRHPCTAGHSRATHSRTTRNRTASVASGRPPTAAPPIAGRAPRQQHGRPQPHHLQRPRAWASGLRPLLAVILNHRSSAR